MCRAYIHQSTSCKNVQALSLPFASLSPGRSTSLKRTSVPCYTLPRVEFWLGKAVWIIFFPSYLRNWFLSTSFLVWSHSKPMALNIFRKFQFIQVLLWVDAKSPLLWQTQASSCGCRLSSEGYSFSIASLVQKCSEHTCIFLVIDRPQTRSQVVSGYFVNGHN